MFYWVTIMFSQTLGTALGDWTADTARVGLHRRGGASSACCSPWSPPHTIGPTISRTGLFWAAFILTRPLGAVIGDFLDKPISAGGLALSRYAASAALLVFIVACITIFPQKPASTRH